MKRFLTLIMALIVVASVTACGRQSNPMGTVVVGEVEANTSAKATAVSYSDGTVVTRFILDENGTWRWAENASLPLQEGAVQEVLDGVAILSQLKPLANIDEISAYGLESPTRYVAVSYSDDTKVVFYLNYQDKGGLWYMRTADAEKVYIAPAEVCELTTRGVYDMMQLPALPELTEDNIKNITVRQGEESVVLTYKDNTWFHGYNPAGAKQVMIDAVMGLQIAKCIDYAPAEGAAAVCGLTEPVATVVVKYVNTVGVETEETITIGDYRESMDGYYAQINGDSAIYLLAAEAVEPILK